MSDQTIAINRAPVLTLWAAVVAERLGYDREAALSLGRAVAGLNAQAKGRALGIYHPSEAPAERAPRPPGPGAEFRVQVLGRPVPARHTPEGIRAVTGDKPIDPDKVEDYLSRAFGDSYPAARAAMDELAASFDPGELEDVSYALYEKFRPRIAPGKRGWGQKGDLDLARIRALVKRT